MSMVRYLKWTNNQVWYRFRLTVTDTQNNMIIMIIKSTILVHKGLKLLPVPT